MSSVDCGPMVELSSSVFLRFSLVFNLTICIAGVPVFLWATWKLWSVKYSKLFHVNFKIIFQLHLFGFLLHCFGRISLHSLDLFNYITMDNACHMIPNIYRCFIFRLMYNSGLWITNSTAVSLILERWLATKRSVTYEKDSVVIGIFLALMQFVIAALPLGFLYSQTKFEGVTMYYCTTSVTSAPYSAQVGATVSIIFQIVAKISFHFLYRINKIHRKSDVQSSLSNRFQLEQNISSITCLKTFANMSVVYIIFQNVCFITYLQFASSLELHQRYSTLELIGSFPAYGIVSIIFLSVKMKKIRNRIEQKLSAHLALKNDLYHESFKRQIA